MAKAKTRNIEELAQLNVEVTKELKKQLAEFAVKEDVSIKSVVENALTVYLKGQRDWERVIAK